MTRPNQFGIAAAFVSVMIVSTAQSQRIVRPQKDHPHVGHATELDVRLHEMQHRLHRLAIEEATIEVEKIKHHLSIAKKHANVDDIKLLELELKQATIQVEMKRVDAETAGLRIEIAKERISHLGRDVRMPKVDEVHQQSARTSDAHAERLLAEAEMVGKLAEADLMELRAHAEEGRIPKQEAAAQEIRINAKAEYEQTVLRLEAKSPASKESRHAALKEIAELNNRLEAQRMRAESEREKAQEMEKRLEAMAVEADRARAVAKEAERRAERAAEEAQMAERKAVQQAHLAQELAEKLLAAERGQEDEPN